MFTSVLSAYMRPATLESTVESSQQIDYSTLVGVIFSTAVVFVIVASDPIIIDGKQDVMTSALHIANPTGNCLEIVNGAFNVVIENSEIGPCGDRRIEDYCWHQ